MSHFHTTPEGTRRGREPEPGAASRQTPNRSCTRWLNSSLLPAGREPEENRLTARYSCPPPSCLSLPVPRLNQKAASPPPRDAEWRVLDRRVAGESGWADGHCPTHFCKCTYEGDDWFWISTMPDLGNAVFWVNSLFDHSRRVNCWGFPDGPVVRTPRFHCSGHRFDPWSGN